MDRYFNDEFNKIVSPILGISEFQQLKNCRHHGISRYSHSLRVAYYAYVVTKFLKLNYIDTTEAALLHDFFIDEVKEENGYMRLIKHPMFAVLNAKKYFKLTDMQEDIIKTHMFPITFRPPKYLESWIVDIVDDVAAIYERCALLKKRLKAANTFLFLLLINFINMR